MQTNARSKFPTGRLALLLAALLIFGVARLVRSSGMQSSETELGDARPPHAAGSGVSLLAREPEQTTSTDNRLPERKNGSLELTPGASVRYLVELRGETELILEAAAPAGGQLEVSFAAWDPADDSRTALPEATAAVSPQHGRCAGSVRLPQRPGLVIEVALTWTGEPLPTANAVVQRLELVELEARARPPIVFISVDTMSARNMSLYGYGRETTPRLEQFAREEAVTFESCKANAPWTLPSYLSQMTGLAARAHRPSTSDVSAATLDPYLRNQLVPQRWTIAEMLRAAGYPTAAFIDNPILAPLLGFSQGFDVYDTKAAERDSYDLEGGLRLIERSARGWITRQEAESPFFAFLQIYDLHGPYIPEESWRAAFEGDIYHRRSDVTALVAKSTPLRFHTIPIRIMPGIESRGAEPTQHDTGPIVAAYDAKMLEIDTLLGELLDEFAQTEWYDDAVIVISADHGESMLDHGWYFRHESVYEEVVHVPLLIKLPEGKHAGLRVSESVQLVDLYPTIRELVGLPIDYARLDGRSLLPHFEDELGPAAPILCQGDLLNQDSIEFDGWKLVRWGFGNQDWRTALTHPIFAAAWEPLVPEQSARFYQGGDLDRAYPKIAFEDSDEAVLEGQRFLALAAGHSALDLGGTLYELFDLRSDPLEQNDVRAAHPELFASLRKLLEERVARAEAESQRYEFHRASAEDDAATLEVLRSLGYVGDD